MVITIDSGTWALIYEFALIHAIFGLDWIGSGFSGNFMDWIGLGQRKWTHVQLWPIAFSTPAFSLALL